jgi:hypothetical protein
VTAQEVSNIVTLLVAIATGWLAWVTYRVAKVSKDALLLQSQPFLAFRGVSLKLGQIRDITAKTFPPALRIGLVLRNPGKVAVEYRVEKLAASLNGDDLPLTELLSKGGRIFPDQEESFFYPVSALKAPPHPGSDGLIEADLVFWATAKQRHTLKLKYKIIITSIQPNLNWEWVAIDEPKYDA